MLSTFLLIKGFVAAILGIATGLGFGFAFAALGALMRPWWGIFGAGACGAVGMAIFLLSGWAGDDSSRIARLEAENARLEAKRVELKLTQEAFEKTFSELRRADEHNEELSNRLREITETLSESPECTVPKEFTDGLKEIR